METNKKTVHKLLKVVAAILSQHRQSKMSTEIRKQINIRWIKLRYANDVLHHMKKGRAHGPENITLGGGAALKSWMTLELKI